MVINKKLIVHEHNNKRESNLELLRIVSIILIIAFHIQRSEVYRSSSYNTFFQVVGLWGILGVDCFIMISAWFSIGKKTKPERVLKIIMQTIEYLLAFLILKLVIDGVSGYSVLPNLLSIEKESLSTPPPLWGGYYWFVAPYVLMYLCSQILNLFIEQLSKNSYKKTMILLTFLEWYFMFERKNILTYTFVFIYIYMLTGYIKLHKNGKLFRYPILVAMICFFLICGGRAVDHVLPSIVSNLVLYTVANYSRTSYIIIIFAAALFQIFVELKMPYSKIINTFASFTLGIYLFHENHLINLAELVPMMIANIIRNPILNYLLSILLIFCFGSFVEFLRIRISGMIKSRK